MATSGTFYVYEHWRLDRDECFYVGKGRAGRAYSMNERNRHHKAIVAKLSRIGSALEVKMVAVGLSEADAFALEIERISFWREAGADLANITNGGEGAAGLKHTAETKGILSEIGKIRGAPKLTKEQKEKASEWHRGRKRSPETCARIADKARGRPSFQKGKPSPLRGRTASEATCVKMSEARKDYWQKRRDQNNGVLVGRKMSENEKLQVSIRKKNWWALKKMEKSNGN